MERNKATIMEANTTFDTTLSGLHSTRSTPGLFSNGLDDRILFVVAHACLWLDTFHLFSLGLALGASLETL